MYLAEIKELKAKVALLESKLAKAEADAEILRQFRDLLLFIKTEWNKC